MLRKQGEFVKLSAPSLPSLEGRFILPAGYYSQREIDDVALLARLVYAESRGEPFEGQVAVAAVLLNRVKHPDFPDSVHQAIYQPGQFEPVANGTIYQTPNNQAYKAVLDAMSGSDPTNGALFFWNPHKVPPRSWVWTREIKSRIGNHVFA
ncbi:MAG: cell wall hydrolase [Bacillota bacterium]|nr:cell wall hydrolase [Bacillota bacterium]